MISLYRKKDFDIINNNVKKIQDEARRYAINNKIEPKQEEYIRIKNIILNFVRDKQRIIYGGYCWDLLVKDKTPDDGIYSKDFIEMPDVEFYSPNPIKDLIDLCDLLYSKNCKYVEGKSAQHHETYKVFVEYINVVDISYMPKILFNKMQTKNYSGVKICHPNFITIDFLRMFNDPINSYWRLSKHLPRINKVMNLYPLKINKDYKEKRIDTILSNILEFIRKNIIPNSNLLVFGYYGYEFYTSKGTGKEKQLYVPYFDVISTNLEKESKEIYKKLTDYDKYIKVEEYHKFFQFLDRRVCFTFKGNEILNIYGNKNMCIPFINIPKKNIKVVTYPYMILMFMSKSLYHLINGHVIESRNLNYLMDSLVKVRNSYLDKNNLTILDESIFKEFNIECDGDTMEPMREFRLSSNKSISINYNPLRKNPKAIRKFLSISYDNSSGNVNTGKTRFF